MILPTKIALNKAKADETKKQIDEGLALARKVDAMRELKVTQEANIKQWRDITVKVVQDEINEILSQRDTLKQEIKTAQERRDELRKPLDYEWLKLKEERETVDKNRIALFLERQSFKIESESFETEKIKVSKAIEKAEINEKNTEKLKVEVQVLKEMAQRESSLIKLEREKSNQIIERKLSELENEENSYQVAFKTIEVREKQVEDKELELITRENDLARRIKNLQRVEVTQ